VTFDPAKCGADREMIRLALLDRQIEARPLWKPMHLQPLFKGTRYVGRGLDEHLFANGLCLPSGSDMSDSEQDEVIGIISDTLKG
jgi:pyridoxal phosphate-dependent aminotransferase EpsN